VTAVATTRRNVLRATGGVGAATLGSVVGSGTAVGQSSPPRLVFTYDDGYVEDYTQTFGVHQHHGAPACAAVPSASIGRSDDYLDLAQVREMVGAGWEVMSHAIGHEALGAVTLTESVSAGDTRLYTDSTVLGRTPHQVEVVDGEKRAVGLLTGDGADDQYLELESPLGESFDAGALVRFTEFVVRRVLENSKQSLSYRGFTVDNLVLPYGRYDQRTLALVEEYYDAVANVVRGGINPVSELDPYRLSRAYFDEERMSESDLAAFMDRVATPDTLGLLGGHSRNPALTGERIELAIELARERGIEIVTLSTALETFGVVEPTPARATPPTPESTPTPTRTTPSTPTPRADSDDSLVGGLFDWLSTLFE
jgi:peptidoglycan/xylan/chitin deacetylase (PgdA/CDA1 family)